MAGRTAGQISGRRPPDPRPTTRALPRRARAVPAEGSSPALNPTQGLVLGFLGAAVTALAAILIADPAVFAATTLPVPTPVFVVGLTAFVAVLGVGVVRRWRWTFWLVLVAFLAGPLRAIASAAQLAGWVAADGPSWYVATQGLIGVVQFVIGIVMLRSYRRAGVWGVSGR